MNFVGAAREMKAFFEFLEELKTQAAVSQFCSSKNISWKFRTCPKLQRFVGSCSQEYEDPSQTSDL